MQRLLIAPLIAVSLAWSVPETGSNNTKAPAKKSPSKSTQMSLTGCLDQQGETYVIRELSTAGAVSRLKGKSFSDDNFARYVGHKVTVHGTIEKQDQAAVMHVTKIDDAGPGCTGR